MIEDVQDIQDIAVTAGEIVLENGGETYRAEDTVVHIATALGAKDSSAFITPTVVIFSCMDDGGTHHTVMRRITRRGTNMLKLSQMNELSYRLVNRGTTSNPAQVRTLLRRIIDAKEYSYTFLVLMGALSSAFFTFMLEGNIFDAIASFIIGALTRVIMIFFNDILSGKNSFILSLICGAFISFSSEVSAFLPAGISPPLVLGGSIMQVVPGLAFVNGVRDVISGDLVSGGARLLEALMTAMGLSIGSVAGMYLAGVL
ncbi:threonine/serine exporter family protein [Treponema zioleckii]|uniref:threonine/serine exporter family protein n=1 Tax=Treponema zioleckii TaxID=331680 RepID=UPI00168B818C|nr:threonine/serine exporter family protein [Treponema zioleckii]